MKTKIKKFLILLVAMVMMLSSAITVSATAITTEQADQALKTALNQGKSNNPTSTSYAGKQYEIDGGGYATWLELFDGNSVQTGYINENKFNTLSSGAKRQYLEDMISISNDVVDSEIGNEAGVTTSTQTTWMNNLQNCSGVGSQLMTTLLANTKPDYVTANRIYQPFSGVVGTVLGLGSILIMAGIAITMVLDLSYIGIPAFRMLVDGEDGGQGGQGGHKPKFISHEAISSVQMAEGGNGGAGQNGGSNKAAVGMYFKKRVIMLICLGVCLLYLIQGQIFTLVGWILDLVSGFLGF